MTPEQRAGIDHGSEEYKNRVMGSKIQVIGWSLYAAILWCLKLCIAAVYARLTYVHQMLFRLQSLVSLTFSMQEWNLPPGDTRTPSVCHSPSDLYRRCPHNPVFLPAVPPFLADLA